MKISLSWLKQYVNLDGVTTDELKRAITFLGFEVEGVVSTGLAPLQNVVVGEILTREKIPNLKKDISLCTVDVGAANGGVRQIVCGAPNCDAGKRVPVALPGAYSLSIQNSERWVLPVMSISRLRNRRSTSHGSGTSPCGIWLNAISSS